MACCCNARRAVTGVGAAHALARIEGPRSPAVETGVHVGQFLGKAARIGRLRVESLAGCEGGDGHAEHRGHACHPPAAALQAAERYRSGSSQCLTPVTRQASLGSRENNGHRIILKTGDGGSAVGPTSHSCQALRTRIIVMMPTPTRMMAMPVRSNTPTCSPARATPNSTATGGFTYA